MGSIKRHTSILRCAVLNFLSATFTAVFPLLVQKSYFYGYVFMLFVCSFSSFHIVTINKRSIFPRFFTLKNELETSQSDKGRRNVSDRKVSQVVFIILLSISCYYLVSIIFGAPIFTDHSKTLYYSCLMTLLTVYPLICYWYTSQDGVAAFFRMFLDGKYENLSECHLRMVVKWTIVGSWVGAFPIPLDWDRSWQEWPMTCCIGATLGCSLAHFLICVKLLYAHYYEKRKIASNLSV